jgi:cellulose biosynthesis protein BcsQ
VDACSRTGQSYHSNNQWRSRSRSLRVDSKADATRTRLKLITSDYDLANADARIPVEWLIKCQPRRSRGLLHSIGNLFFLRLFQRNDIRYTLAELLHSNAVRDNFHLVIIDSPPRITTGGIQALCAGSHVLIPTKLDMGSARAAVQLVRGREVLFGSLQST